MKKVLFLKNAINDPVALSLVYCYNKQYTLEKTEEALRKIIGGEQKKPIFAFELFPFNLLIKGVGKGVGLNDFFLFLSFASNVLTRIFPPLGEPVLTCPQERVVSPGPEAYILTDNWGNSYPSRAGRYLP